MVDALTASNNPTPEVERYELNHGEMMRSDDGEWYHKPQVDRYVEVLQAEENITRILLEGEIADIRAIAGESRIALYDALKEASQRADIAEATIESLTIERNKWCGAWMKAAFDEAEAYRERDEAIERAEASNKLLSERVAVLERDLKHVRSMAGKSRDDLRRALAAREAK